MQAEGTLDPILYIGGLDDQRLNPLPILDELKRMDPDVPLTGNAKAVIREIRNLAIWLFDDAVPQALQTIRQQVEGKAAAAKKLHQEFRRQLPSNPLYTDKIREEDLPLLQQLYGKLLRTWYQILAVIELTDEELKHLYNFSWVDMDLIKDIATEGFPEGGSKPEPIHVPGWMRKLGSAIDFWLLLPLNLYRTGLMTMWAAQGVSLEEIDKRLNGKDQ